MFDSLIPKSQSRALQRAAAPFTGNSFRSGMLNAKAPNVNTRIIDQRYMSPKSKDDWGGVVRHRRASELPDMNDYRALAILFTTSNIIFAAFNDKAKARTGVRMIVERNSNGTWKENPNHVLSNRNAPFNLNNFNPDMGLKDYFDALDCHQDLFGTVKSVIIREHFDLNRADGRIVAIEPVMPYCIQDRFGVDANRTWLGYWYTPDSQYANQEPKPVHPKNVIIDPIYNPFVSSNGWSATGTLLDQLVLDGLISNQNRAFFENYAIPSLIVFLKNSQNQTRFSLQEKLQHLQEMWQAKFGVDGYSQRAPAFVTGDIDVKVLETEMEKLVIDKIRDRIESRAGAVYGVTALWEVHMKHANNRASAEEANKTYFYRTLNPFLIRAKLKLERTIGKEYLRNDERLNYDYTDMVIADFIERDWRKDNLLIFSKGGTSKDELRSSYNYLPMQDDTGALDIFQLQQRGKAVQPTTEQLQEQTQ